MIDGRAGDPVDVARHARGRRSLAAHGPVRAAASRRTAGRVAAPRLPRGPLRARGDLARRRRRARGREPRGPRRVHPPALASGRRRAAPLQRRPAGADRADRGRVRRRAPALARGVHRAQRQLGARGAPALLPPAHAPLPDPQDRGADRPRPLARHRPDRALAGAAGEGAGGMRVAILGAGGTIAPAIVRDLADSDEVEELAAARPRRGARPQAVAAATAAARRAPPGSTRARARRRARSPRARGLRTSSSTPRATASTSTRWPPACDAGCHYLDLGGLYWMTELQLELDDQFRREGLLALLGHRLGARARRT